MKNTRIEKKKRVLVYSDYNCTTGFAVVTKNILKKVLPHMSGKVHLDIVAVNWFGDDVPDDYEIKPQESSDFKKVKTLKDGAEKEVWKRVVKREGENIIISSAQLTDDSGDLYGRNAMLTMLRHIDYDLLFIVQDISIMSSVLPVIRKIKDDKKAESSKQFKTLYYMPMDGPMMGDVWFKDFDLIDRVVAYTDFAKFQAAPQLPKLYKGGVGVIYHGIDCSIFNNMRIRHTEEIQTFRDVYFGENSKKFIIGNINRNQFRKDIPKTILAFADFKKIAIERNYQQPFLYLHMIPDDPLGWNLNYVAHQAGLIEGEDFIFTPQSLIENPPDDGMMAMIYNSLDMYVTSTAGEGFGLTVIEAMACGVPVVAPAYSAVKEIADKSNGIVVVEELEPYISTTDSMVRYSPVVEFLVEAIENCFREGKSFSIRAEEFAKKLDWSVIGRQWLKEFKSLITW